MTVLVFKQIPRDDKGHKFLYTLDFLDMKFTIAEHRLKNEIKIFAGFRQDDGSFAHLQDYKQKWWWQLAEPLRKKEPSSQDKVQMYVEDIKQYIYSLYGFKRIDVEIHEHMNMLIEQWLETE
jgi:hypothetical protein